MKALHAISPSNAAFVAAASTAAVPQRSDGRVTVAGGVYGVAEDLGVRGGKSEFFEVSCRLRLCRRMIQLYINVLKII
jgi:hypothetical protein